MLKEHIDYEDSAEVELAAAGLMLRVLSTVVRCPACATTLLTITLGKMLSLLESCGEPPPPEEEIINAIMAVKSMNDEARQHHDIASDLEQRIMSGDIGSADELLSEIEKRLEDRDEQQNAGGDTSRKSH